MSLSELSSWSQGWPLNQGLLSEEVEQAIIIPWFPVTCDPKACLASIVSASPLLPHFPPPGAW